MHSMVEGCYARRSSLSKDMLNYAFEICEYVSRGNTKIPDTMRPQPNIPVQVMLRSIRTVVRLTVNLDSQLQARTKEVEHIAPRRMLPAEFKTTGTSAKRLPEKHLRQGQAGAEGFGLPLRRFRAVEHLPLHRPWRSPSPCRGGS